MMNKTLSAQQSATQRKKGFTLTEIAIVLGIMGLILGAIWTAASSVYANNRQQSASTEVLQVVQATKNLYATQANFGASGTQLTAGVANGGNLPASYVNGSTILHPWNGTSGISAGHGVIYVDSDIATSAGDSLTVTLANVPTTACIALLTNLSGAPGYTGNAVTAVGATSAALTEPAAASGITLSTAAVDAGTASGKCSTQKVNNLKIQFLKN